MSNHVRRTIGVVNFLEQAMVNTGWFKMVRDGSKPETALWKSAPEPTFYVKVYRMKLDGAFTNTWVKFVYNVRDNWADFEVTYKDPVNRIPNPKEATCRQLAIALTNTAARLDDMPLDDLPEKARAI